MKGDRNLSGPCMIVNHYSIAVTIRCDLSDLNVTVKTVNDLPVNVSVHESEGCIYNYKSSMKQAP